MSAPVEHLPGCERQHTARQRCSTWVPSAPKTSPRSVGAPRGDPLRKNLRLFASIAVLLANAALSVYLWGLVVDSSRACDSTTGECEGLGVVGAISVWVLTEAVLALPTILALAVVLSRVGKHSR